MAKKEAPKPNRPSGIDYHLSPGIPHKKSIFSFDNTVFYNRKNFTILSILTLLGMISLSIHFGVNGDEKFQIDYSKKLWSYYSSLGKDTSALYVPEGNMHLYGGLFDLTAVSLNKLIGQNDEFTPSYHTVRRVLCAVFGFIALLFTSLFAKRIGGWPLAYLTMLLMLLTPRFMGDAMVNPKDIPFAAGYIMTLYFISIYIRQLPKPSLSAIMGIVFGVMIALNTRAGGLLLIVYLFLFTAIYIGRSMYQGHALTTREITVSIAYTMAVGLIAYFAGILFWPYALAHPLVNPFKALTEFTHQPITISVLFSGLHSSSSLLPWNYIPEWIIRTIPIFSIVGVFFFFRLLKKRYHDLPFLEIFMLFFTFLFPISYAIYKHSTLHDGWRHFLFVYPSLLLIASLGWILWFTSFSSKYFRFISVILLLSLMSENLYSIITYHPYQYTYFNPLFGGIKKAYGNFETDYWMLSVKEASTWLKTHEKIDKLHKPITITTNGLYPAQVYLSDTSHNLKVTYTRYYERSEKDWDYAIFYSRFIHRDQLLNHTWPPKGTVYTVKADGVPICAVVKRDNREDYLGFQALEKNDAISAMKHFLAALKYDFNNETVSSKLAELYKNQCLYEKAADMALQSLNAFPSNPATMNLLEEIKYEQQKDAQ
ncbi:MAG: hypothetical protein IPF93_07390 [Saprospiraceae bacterium]|nr:hypothetical protein [Saprospiraceae bacterium]